MAHPLRRALLASLAAGGGLLLAGCAGSSGRSSPPSEGPRVSSTINPKAYAYAVISVADMEQALALWSSRFGMQIIVRREGRDPALAAVWGLGSDDIIDQALLRTPGMAQGGVHLVRFRLPGRAVREGAAATDLVPKSVDIAVRDLPARHAELTAAGYCFRSSIGRFETDGVVVDEVHLPGPDGVNLVLLEQQGKPEPVSPEGYGVAPQIVATSPDNRREKAFLEQVLGLEETSYHRFAGPEVERTIGLPAGAGLDIRIFGDPDYAYGRLEIVQYEGVTGADLYPRARPPARGLLSVTFFVPDVAAVLARAAAASATTASDTTASFAAPVDHGMRRTIFGEARIATLTSPAGLRIDLVQR